MVIHAPCVAVASYKPVSRCPVLLLWTALTALQTHQWHLHLGWMCCAACSRLVASMYCRTQK